MEEVVAAIIVVGVGLIIGAVPYIARLERTLSRLDSRLDSRLVQVGDLELPKNDPNAQQLGKPTPDTAPRNFRVHWDFEVPFSSQPKVIASLKSIDLDDPKAHIHRITVWVDNVTSRGFDLYFETSRESLIYNATASWVAIIPPNP